MTSTAGRPAFLKSQLRLLLTTSQAETIHHIAEQEPVIGLLTASPRPLFTSEIMGGAKAMGLARYLKSRPRGGSPDPLLAPIKTPGGKLIGIVAVSERGGRGRGSDRCPPVRSEAGTVRRASRIRVEQV